MSLFLFFFRFFRHEKEAGKNSLAYACMLSATDSSNHQMADSNRRRVILSFERPIDTTNFMERDGISPTQKLEENG